MQNIRKSGRFSFRSNKKYSYSRTNNSYTNNKPRSKGSNSQLYDKYIKLAKEASSVGDRIQAEYYHQFADHYSRIMIENGIKYRDDEKINEDENKKYLENSNVENNQENKPLTDINIKSSENSNIEEEAEETDKTLETVSFISQPAKKVAKVKK